MFNHDLFTQRFVVLHHADLQLKTCRKPLSHFSLPHELLNFNCSIVLGFKCVPNAPRKPHYPESGTNIVRGSSITLRNKIDAHQMREAKFKTSATWSDDRQLESEVLDIE